MGCVGWRRVECMEWGAGGPGGAMGWEVWGEHRVECRGGMQGVLGGHRAPGTGWRRMECMGG